LDSGETSTGACYCSLFRWLEALASQVVSPYCSVETALVVGRVKPNAFPAPVIRSVQGLSLPNLGYNPAISEEVLDKQVNLNETAILPGLS